MNTTTKAVLASSVAVFLLLGGSGSLAYWQSSDSAGAGDLNSGSLALTGGTTAGWTLNGATVADPSAVRVVPGDQLGWTGSFVITAVGDHLTGELEITGGAEAGTLAPYAETTAIEWVVNGRTHDQVVTSADDGKSLDVQVAVDFPFGSAVDNSSQGKVIDLTDVAVTLTQTDATPQV